MVNEGESDDIINLLRTALNRDVKIDALSPLISALNSETETADLKDTAIGIDANVFLRLSTHSRFEDVIDYLTSSHRAPLILPGQAIQEFWNNQLSAVDTVAASLKKSFEKLQDDLEKIDDEFGDRPKEIKKLLDEFGDEHGHIYSESTVRKTSTLIGALQERAYVPFVPRDVFSNIALQRKRTKTPPGFKDQGDGDFFIWVDFLYGLKRAQSEKKNFSKAVLVTNDKKADWSRSGCAHPILVAEVKTILDVPFKIWSLDNLAGAIIDVLQ